MRRLLAQLVEEHARYDIPHAYKSLEVQGGPTSQLPYTSQLLDSLIQSINPSDYTLYSTTHGPYSYLLFCLCQLFRRHSPDEGFP